MSRPAPPRDLDNAIREYLAGESVQVVAKRHRTAERRLAQVLRDGGLWRTPEQRAALRLSKLRAIAEQRRLKLPEAEIVARYIAGESENALARVYGVSRSVIRRHLLDVPIRGCAEANRRMVATRTPEENRRNTMAAHEAVRGRVRPFEEACRMAATRERNASPVSSAAERILADWLRERGVAVIPQKAVGPYNVDLAAGPVAVEIFGGGWHASGTHAARAPQRFRYLLDQGWSFVIVWVDGRHWPLMPAAADDIAAFVQETRRDPSAPRQYRVISGHGQLVARGEADDDELSVVMPSRGRNGSRT